MWGRWVYGFRGAAALDTIRRIRGGLPVAEFGALAEWLGMSGEELAPLLGISRATLHRRKTAGHLDPPESERLVRFARLLARATGVLGSEAAARKWLKQPAFAFPGESPLSFIHPVGAASTPPAHGSWRSWKCSATCPPQPKSSAVTELFSRPPSTIACRTTRSADGSKR